MHLDPGHAGGEVEELVVGLGEQVLVSRLSGHLVGEPGVLEAAYHLGEGIDLRLEGPDRSDHLVGAFLVVPEALGGLLGLEVGELAEFLVVVKASRGWSRSAPQGRR